MQVSIQKTAVETYLDYGEAQGGEPVGMTGLLVGLAVLSPEDSGYGSWFHVMMIISFAAGENLVQNGWFF